MTVSHPPRLATALLHRVFDDDEPLVGDLFEGFSRNHSRLWFWKQTLSAVAFRSRQKRDHTHPLGLASRAGWLRTDTGTIRMPSRTINLSASPVIHGGGLTLVGLGTLVALVRPQAWWMFVPAVAGGVLIAVAILFVRGRRQSR